MQENHWSRISVLFRHPPSFITPLWIELPSRSVFVAVIGLINTVQDFHIIITIWFGGIINNLATNNLSFWSIRCYSICISDQSGAILCGLLLIAFLIYLLFTSSIDLFLAWLPCTLIFRENEGSGGDTSHSCHHCWSASFGFNNSFNGPCVLMVALSRWVRLSGFKFLLFSNPGVHFLSSLLIRHSDNF